MSTIADKRLRCPRCQSRPAVQNAIELRPGVQYLTLRCISCGLVYDSQVPSDPDRPRLSIDRGEQMSPA